MGVDSYSKLKQKMAGDVKFRPSAIIQKKICGACLSVAGDKVGKFFCVKVAFFAYFDIKSELIGMKFFYLPT